MGKLVQLNAVPARELPVTKRRLAEMLGRSTRWIEYRMREGLPFERTGQHGHPRYYPTKVNAWLQERAQQPQTPRSTSEQVGVLTQEINKLHARLEQLERKVA